MGGLSACLFLLLLSKFQEQAREAPVAERESKQAVPAEGGGAGTGAGGKIQTKQETPTPKPDRTDTPTLTHSPTLGLVPECRPLCRDTQTSSANPAHPQNTPWTHTESQAFAPTHIPPQTLWAPYSSQRVERGTEGGKTAGVREDMEPKPWELGYQLPHSFPKTQ